MVRSASRERSLHRADGRRSAWVGELVFMPIPDLRNVVGAGMETSAFAVRWQCKRYSRMAHISLDWSSIKLQRRSKLSFAHPREIVARINISRSSEEEFVKSFDRTRTQRINHTRIGDLCKKRFGA